MASYQSQCLIWAFIMIHIISSCVCGLMTQVVFSFLSHETAAEPVPALPTKPQPQTAGDESDRGVNDFTSVSETVAVQSF